MKEINLDTALLEAGDLVKRGYAAAISNAGKIIALITVFVTALVIFTDVGFADFCTEEFTSTLIFMLLASYLMYFSTSDSGEKLAEEGEEYVEARKKFLEVKSKIAPTDVSPLRDYLAAYAERERDYRIRAYLTSLGYSHEEYQKWLDCGDKAASKEKRAAFKRAKRIKAVSLSVVSVLSGGEARAKSELSSPEDGKLIRMLIRMIPTTLCMLFSASVILTAKDGLTVDTVIDGLVKLSTLPIIGFKGYAAGYNFVRFSKIPWLETKTRILEGYMATRYQAV